MLISLYLKGLAGKKQIKMRESQRPAMLSPLPVITKAPYKCMYDWVMTGDSWQVTVDSQVPRFLEDEATELTKGPTIIGIIWPETAYYPINA